MYIYTTKIKLHETDAAGLLFFSHQFEIMHDAYESLLEQIGYGFASLIREKKYFLPIVHAESDYKLPLFVGDVINIHVRVSGVGTSSFSFSYQLFNRKKQLVGTGKTVHVTIDKKRHQAIPIPKQMKDRIVKLYKKDAKIT